MPKENKQPIDWHRGNLKNRGASMDVMQKEIDSLQARFNKSKIDYDLLSRQIQEAEKTGVTEFDAERFLIVGIKKNAKPSPS